VLNNAPPASSGIFFSYRKKCELCDKEHKDNCEFASGGNDRLKLRQFINKLEDRDLILVVHWRTQPQANIQLIEKPAIKEYD